LLGFLALMALAAGQAQPARLTPSQQQQLFARHRVMIAALVDGSIEIAATGDQIQRSRSYRKIVMEFQKSLDQAAGEEDPGRVAELGKHLDTILRRGLAPSLQEANRQVGPKGTGRDDLIDLRDRSLELVDWLERKARDKWADTPEVREVINSLEKTKKEIGASVSRD
jgi:hypothetical protein